MIRTAEISECGKYRYTLYRRWGAVHEKMIAWMMLNPSTADGETEDNTSLKVIHYSQREGFGSAVVVNQYAYRSTDPGVLWGLAADEARGPKNKDRVIEALTHADRVVYAWGNPGGRGVPLYVAELNLPAWCLGRNKNGSPKHPLYLRKDTPMIPWV